MLTSKRSFPWATSTCLTVPLGQASPVPAWPARGQIGGTWPANAVRACLLAACWFAAGSALGQTAFVDFNSPGQYTNHFNPSNGGVAGDYSFMENTTAGVGGGGGVSVFQSTDTTAVYTNGSWDFSTTGATLYLSAMVLANGQVSGNKVQLGILNLYNN